MVPTYFIGGPLGEEQHLVHHSPMTLFPHLRRIDDEIVDGDLTACTRAIH